MTTVLRIISFTGLALSLIPSLLVFAGRLDHATSIKIMIVGMLMWFGTAVFWIKPGQKSES